jgi:hypothetical protein
VDPGLLGRGVRSRLPPVVREGVLRPRAGRGRRGAGGRARGARAAGGRSGGGGRARGCSGRRRRGGGVRNSRGRRCRRRRRRPVGRRMKSARVGRAAVGNLPPRLWCCRRSSACSSSSKPRWKRVSMSSGSPLVGAALGVVATRGLPRGLEDGPRGRVRGQAGEQVEAAVAADELAPPPAEPRGFPCPGDETAGRRARRRGRHRGRELWHGEARKPCWGRVPRLRTGREVGDGTGGGALSDGSHAQSARGSTRKPAMGAPQGVDKRARCGTSLAFTASRTARTLFCARSRRAACSVSRTRRGSSGRPAAGHRSPGGHRDTFRKAPLGLSSWPPCSSPPAPRPPRGVPCLRSPTGRGGWGGSRRRRSRAHVARR